MSYLVQYIEEREEEDDWQRHDETETLSKAIEEADELMEATNIDAVRVLKFDTVYEKQDPNSWGRPWSKKRKK